MYYDSTDYSRIAVAGLIVASLSVGYWAGRATLKRGPDRRLELRNNEDSLSVNAQTTGSISEVKIEDSKLVLVVRSDLGMSAGKIAAQCSHATLACYKALSKSNPSLIQHWERTGQTKVALRCMNEDELLLLQAQAESLNLCARSIQDAGRTQIAAGSRTVLGIGPGPARLINQVSGKLRLL